MARAASPGWYVIDVGEDSSVTTDVSSSSSFSGLTVLAFIL